jgi:DNA polymerase elongation subunit (family B)
MGQSAAFDSSVRNTQQGIETVRRDGCPAVSKLLEASLRLLFATRDLSQVRLCGGLATDLLCAACQHQRELFASELGLSFLPCAGISLSMRDV